MITVKNEVSDRRVASLLCCAFEGGSNYWYMIDSYDTPSVPRSVLEEDGQIFKHVDYPLSGGAVIIEDKLDDGKTYRLDGNTIKSGMQIMADKYPRHWANFLAERQDADTGDCFLQCCLFGKEIYG